MGLLLTNRDWSFDSGGEEVIFSKICKWILLVLKETIFFIVLAGLVWFGYVLIRSRCQKVTPVLLPATQESTQVTTPVFGNPEGHTTIKIPIRRPHADTTKPRPPDDTIYVDIDQDIHGKIVVTPESLVGRVSIRRSRPALVRFKPGVSVYVGLDSIPPGLTAGLAADMIEVWKFSFGANAGVRNIGSTMKFDTGFHATFNINKHIGVSVARTWEVFSKDTNPKWAVGVNLKLIGG